MEILLYFLAAVCAYLTAGLNPAIIISKAVYKKDIRTCGSGNPGFTNFKRTFGGKWGWPVFFLDLGKAALVVAVCAWLFGKYLDAYQLGAAYTGLFCMLGHAFPIWYGFKGGKGFLVYMSTIWFVDWRAGLLATALLVALLLTTKYMSLSVMCAVTSGVIYLAVAGADSPAVICLCAAQVFFIICRHRENIKRLVSKSEPKFSFSSK